MNEKKKFVDPQPSQEPEDDGEKLGPCNDVVCEDFLLSGLSACGNCEFNPENEEYNGAEYGN